MIFKRYFSSKSIDDRTFAFLHFPRVHSLNHIFQLESGVNFLQRFKNCFSAAENLTPNLPCELIVIFIKDIPIFEYPTLYFHLFNKIDDDLHTVIKVSVDLFLSETNIVRVIRISCQITIALCPEPFQQSLLIIFHYSAIGTIIIVEGRVSISKWF